MKILIYSKRKKQYENIPTLNIIDNSTINDLPNLVEVFDCMKNKPIVTIWNSVDNVDDEILKVWHVDSAIKHLKNKKKCKKEILNHILLKV